MEPTWANVEPILRAQCSHCHGATARRTGSVGAAIYRLDFYDMTEGVCGEAAQAMDPGVGMARSWAPLIAKAITTASGGDRPRMPPAPAPVLADWERRTLMRWADQPFPPRGDPQTGNRMPNLKLTAPKLANTRLSLTALVQDPDGEPVVGVLKVGNIILKMDHAGAYTTTLETGAWPAGRYPVLAVLCDGWGNARYQVATIDVLHDENGLTKTTLYEPDPNAPAGGGTGGAPGSGGPAEPPAAAEPAPPPGAPLAAAVQAAAPAAAARGARARTPAPPATRAAAAAAAPSRPARPARPTAPPPRPASWTCAPAASARTSTATACSTARRAWSKTPTSRATPPGGPPSP